MKMYLDSSTNKLILILGDQRYEWEAGHQLAQGLLSYVHSKLQEQDADWQDLSEITFYSGPGSFTGLRIGATFVNTLAHELNLPLYDHHGRRHRIISPEYGRPAHISKPKK